MVVTPNSRRPAEAGRDHVVVLGAGATGLTAARELSRLGMAVTVVEEERYSVGGRSRTSEFMGCRFDIGPQPLLSESGEVAAFINREAGDQLSEIGGKSRILNRGRYLETPVASWNALLSLGSIEAARCLLSMAQARLDPIETPATLEDWARNQLGARAFSRFYAAYFEKVWGLSASELSVEQLGDWLEPLLSAPSWFRFPRLGIGQMWQSVAAGLESSGQRVRMGYRLAALRHAGGRVIAAGLRDPSGRLLDLVGSHFLSTIPIGELIAKLSPSAPGVVLRAAQAVSYRDLVTVNVVIDRAETFPDQWIDVFDESVRVARISNFKNFSGAMVADPGLTGLGMEYFCSRGDELWSAADAELLDLGRRELVCLGICEPDEVKAGMVSRQREALPVPVVSTAENLGVICEWLDRALPNLTVAGADACWGRSPQDESISQGLLAAAAIAGYARGHKVEASGLPASIGTSQGVDILVGFRSGVAQR